MDIVRTHTVIVVLITGLLSGCGGGTTATGTAGPSAPDNATLHDTTTARSAQEPPTGDTAALSYTIIDAPNGTYGYDIHSGGKLLIHQTNIPGHPGNDGCRTREDAESLAALVMDKIKQGEMPPTVRSEELKRLGIIP